MVPRDRRSWWRSPRPWVGAGVVLVGITTWLLTGGSDRDDGRGVDAGHPAAPAADNGPGAVEAGPLPAGKGKSAGRAPSRPRRRSPAQIQTGVPTASFGVSTVAQARVPEVGIYESLEAPTPTRRLAHPQQSGAPLVFLVRRMQPDRLEVLLPVRPNGSTGWIDRSEVTLAQHDFGIVIELRAHRITVFRGYRVFHQERIGVGTRSTPTPGGLYFTRELIKPVDDAGRYAPNGPYGPYAYGLSGFSEVLSSFAGGDGALGIHGTDRPSTLGRNVSAGCIRMSNAGITKLAETLPLGVPVDVRP